MTLVEYQEVTLSGIEEKILKDDRELQKRLLKLINEAFGVHNPMLSKESRITAHEFHIT